MKYKDIVLIFYCLLIVILTFGIGRISGKISYQSDILKENLNIQNYLPSIDIRRYSPVSETEQSLLNKMSKEGYCLVDVTTENRRVFYYFQKIVYKKEFNLK